MPLRICSVMNDKHRFLLMHEFCYDLIFLVVQEVLRMADEYLASFKVVHCFSSVKDLMRIYFQFA